MRRALVIAGLAAAGCGSFEDPTIVIDHRILAVTVDPPEQVFDLDPQDPPDTLEELGLVPVTVCALTADPGEDRGHAWTLRVCASSREGRCAEADGASIELARGRIDDPETAATPQVACGALPPDEDLLVVLEEAIREDELRGFSGIDLQLSFAITPDGADEAATLYAEKDVRFAARVPEDRVANTNPWLDRIDVEPEDEPAFPLALGRCAEQADPLRIAPGEELPLLPVEPEGVREVYVLPTFDGGSRTFTETLTYQWLASAGSWNRAFTGGPRDLSGALPPLDATWTAPDDVTEETDVSIWVIQRDERLGGAWYESCVRVVP